MRMETANFVEGEVTVAAASAPALMARIQAVDEVEVDVVAAVDAELMATAVEAMRHRLNAG